MEYTKPQVQAVRPVSKDNPDSPTLTPTPKVYFDCHSNPATGESFVLWDDIRIIFADVLYVRHEAKVLPFMKDAELRPLKPLRIAVIPDVVLDVVVDRPLVRLEATITDIPTEATVQDTLQEDTALNLTTGPVSNAPRHNLEYGIEETAMVNNSLIDDPGVRPKPKVPHFVPTAEQEEDVNEAAPIASNINSKPVNDKAQSTNNNPEITFQSHQSPQVHTAIDSYLLNVIKATLGEANSQVDLGHIYRAGYGVKQDFEAARYWYRKAADQGDPAGQCNLGHLYRLELGVDQNHSTAMSWYKKAADQGDAEGQCYIGIVHECGLVGARDYSAAMDWFLKAANQGHAFAQCCIGGLYATGQGVQQDYDKSMEWHLRAANQGLPAAQFMMACMYLNGSGVPQDKAIALDWLSKATSRKHVDFWSQMAMGMMYLGGFGVPQSDSMALVWYLKAARQGLPTAQSAVGGMYRDGFGVSQDYSKALFWLIKAANHNILSAQNDVGSMYLHGQGVPKDYSKAKEWYAKAANLGHEGAKFQLYHIPMLSMLSKFISFLVVLLFFSFIIFIFLLFLYIFERRKYCIDALARLF
ncbi:hypothetical protein BKA57DRAFT_179086 [Linnemannia elongata]|nr:hypothetical protein BKA57DRAFT_179086 [Linnemannia elongata]